MPSASPGHAPTSPSSFVQILPGSPAESLQSVICFSFRQKRYVAYISGRHLNIFTGPNVLAQCLTFAEDLVAVAAETRTGRLAVAAKKTTWIVKPVTEGWSKVWWETALSLRQDDVEDEARTLSWGTEDEVLVGGNRQLSLFSTLPSSRGSAIRSLANEGTIEQRKPLWSISLPSPVRYAAFSPSATLIATCGIHDRLVKIWRRLSFEEGLFDYMYVPHNGTVTYIHWRPPHEPTDEDEEDNEENFVSSKPDDDLETLYTLATDGVLRIWKTGAAHDLEMLTLHTVIDLIDAVPESPSLSLKGSETLPRTRASTRYTCILPSDQFSSAINTIIGLQDVRNKHSSERLRDVVSKDPDVVLSFDGRGRMSAWGVQSIGHKRRPETPLEAPTPPFHITHSENLPIRIPEGVYANIEAWLEGSVFNLVAHLFNGEVRWWRDDSANLFSPTTAASAQLSEVAYYSGHLDGPIHALVASSNSRTLLSSNGNNETILLESTTSGVLQQSSSHTTENRLIDASLLACRNPGDHHSFNLECESSSTSSRVDIKLRDSHGREIDKIADTMRYETTDQTPLLFISKGQPASEERAVVLNSNGRGYSCIIKLSTPSLGPLASFDLPMADSHDPLLHLTAVVDSADLDRFGVVGLTKSGAVLLFHIQVGQEHTLESMLIAAFQSGVEEAGLLASNNDFAAVVSSSRSEMVIVNLTDGYVEHRLQPGKKIRQIVPSPKDSIVAIANDHTIDIFAQGRIGYREEMPPWIQIKQISIAGVGLTVSALTWLGDGGLAVAADGCIFISSNEVDIQDLDANVREATGVAIDSPQTLRMSTVANRLRRPIPVWHPTFVAHIVRFGQWSLAASLVGRLLQKLKFWSEGEVLQPLLNVPAAQLYGAEGIYDEKTLDRDTVNELTQQLDEKDLPQISQSEQRRLKCVLEAMMFCAEHVNGLDNLALRYLYSWKYELLLIEARHPGHGVELNGVSNSGQALVPEMHWREVAFAFHSTSQQPLLDVLMAHYDNKITWNIAKSLGLFAWLSDKEALNQIFESLAQTAYRSSSPPDPINASLYFLALHKKQTLLGLWRIATWHKEQRATMNFLRRDFSQAQNQTAAKKNAYALMGKRRFEYAAAFFLLAEDGASAVSVLAGQCGDIMLAIAVGRLYSGDTSSAIRKLLEERLMPEAKKDNDRWLLSWSYSLLLEMDAAAYALVKPLDGVRDWHQDDPALLNLYQRLRKDSSELEFDAVLRAARILRRMGLWLIALELVSQWEFKAPKPSYAAETAVKETLVNGVESHAPSMLDSFAETPTNSTPKPPVDGEGVVDEKAAREAKAAELLKKIKAKKDASTSSISNDNRPQPTQFQEPDANSLLDAFGF